MRLYLAAASWLSLVLVFSPLTASALGLGDIALDSALNEPFMAEIPLESLEESDLAGLTVELASTETFERYGLDRPVYLADFKFEVAENLNGQAVIRLRSAEPVVEPFVTILLDVRWSSGRLLREYTVLLDPPLFEETVVEPVITPAQSAPAAAPAPAPAPAPEVTEQVAEPVTEYAETDVVAPSGLFQAEVIAESAPATETAVQPEPEVYPEVYEEPAAESWAEPEAPVYAAPAPSPAPSPATGMVEDVYTTERGDTLWRISENARGGTGLSNNQMMLALYRANPDAFMGNINLLKAGAILRIAGANDMEAPGAGEAYAEVVEQNAAWDAQKSGSQAGLIEEQTDDFATQSEEFAELDETTETTETSETDAGTVAEGVAVDEPRLQLVAPAETDFADGTGTAADTLADDSADGMAAGDAEGDLLEGGSGELGGMPDESERLLAIEDAEMEALQQRIAEDGEFLGGESGEVPLGEDGEPLLTTDEFGVAGSGADVTTDITDEPEQPVAAQAAVAEDEGSFIGDLLSSMWLWITVAIVLLAGAFLARRKMNAGDSEATGTWDADLSEPEHGDTLKDFGELPSNTDSIVVEEDATSSLMADSDADLDEHGLGSLDIDDVEPEPAPAIEPEPQVDEPVAADIDFDIDTVEASDMETAVDADLPSYDEDIVQDAVGQDEVETALEKTISTGAPLNLDQADPMAEAEFHMAYGLYDQAADLLARALNDEPDNRPYRVKLIEVYFVWENKDGFLEQARALHSAVDDSSDSDWNKVLILGKQLCPDDPLFSGAASDGPIGDAMDLELSEAGETEVDFTLGGTEVQALDVEFPVEQTLSSETGLDFDLDADAGEDDADNLDELTLNLGGEADTDSDSDSGAASGLDAADIDMDFGAEDFGEATMESPTLSNPIVDEDGSGATMQTQTLESPVVDTLGEEDSASTMETPTLENPINEPTVESPTLDTLGANADTSEMPVLEDPTGLEVDLSGLADLPIESDDMSATGMHESLGDSGKPVFGDDQSRLSPETENIRVGDEDETVLASLEDLGKVAGDTHESGFGDTAATGTVEQPQFDDLSAGDTAEQPGLDTDLADTPDATMTEVGTKLDLARAYIDMGDPDGARSILKEVLDEGGDTQQQEARQLLEELSD